MLAATTALELDCRSCGACCGPDRDVATYVDVWSKDIARLSPRWRRENVYANDEGTQGSIRTKYDPAGKTVCVALRGTVGAQVSCEIYERRPDVCSSFRAGGRECLVARRERGL
jgi:Fe-S-cluster containining protein